MFPVQYATNGLFSKRGSFLKAINWASLLDNTQKTLGVINQAIPIIYQVKPIVSNAKAMFKIADFINTTNDIADISENSETTSVLGSNKPVFYI